MDDLDDLLNDLEKSKGPGSVAGSAPGAPEGEITPPDVECLGGVTGLTTLMADARRSSTKTRSKARRCASSRLPVLRYLTRWR